MTPEHRASLASAFSRFAKDIELLAQRLQEAKPAPPDGWYLMAEGDRITGDDLHFSGGIWRQCGSERIGTEVAEIVGKSFFARKRPVWNPPPPPDGHEWHRGAQFTADDLPDGYRPLLVGEEVQPGDERYRYGLGPWEVSGGRITLAAPHAKHRTKRPLPESEPGKWYVLQTAQGSPSYLKGPCTAEQVAATGYRFTIDRAEAWPFDSWHDAHAVAEAVILHMIWQPSRVVCVQ